MKITNEHLVPQMVLDIGAKIPNAGESERFALLGRLQAIRDFCAQVIEQAEKGRAPRV